MSLFIKFKHSGDDAYQQKHGKAYLREYNNAHLSYYWMLDDIHEVEITDNIFNQAMDDINDYSYERIEITLGYGDGEVQLDFDKIIRPDKLLSLSIRIAEKRDYKIDFHSYQHVFEKMVNLIHLEVECIQTANELLSFFPNLLILDVTYDHLLFFDDNPQKSGVIFTELEKHWPKLEVLILRNFKDDLAQFGFHSNLRYFQSNAYFGADSLSPLVQFPNLEAVELNSTHKAYDMKVFSQLPQLKKLLIFTPDIEQNGWDELILGKNIELVYATMLPSLALLDNNPHLPSLLTIKAGDLTAKDFKKMKWIKREAKDIDVWEYRKNKEQPKQRIHMLTEWMG